MLRYGKTTAKAEVVAEAVGLSPMWVILTTIGSNVCVNCRTIEDAELFLTTVERNFPAIKWKLLNINKLKDGNPQKYEKQVESLEQILFDSIPKSVYIF